MIISVLNVQLQVLIFLKKLQLWIGNILATENQQAIINDVIDVKIGVYLYKN